MITTAMRIFILIGIFALAIFHVKSDINTIDARVRAESESKFYKKSFEEVVKQRDKAIKTAERATKVAEDWRKLYKDQEKETLSEFSANGILTASGSGTVTVLPAYQCKTVSAPSLDGCNTCSITRCTDGKEQWDEPTTSCTMALCAPKRIPYNPKDWEEEKK